MTPEFAYFLKVNVAFALFYAFYRLFFYKDTFFKLRRTTLLAFFGLALLYPLFNMQDWVREQEPIAEVILYYSLIIMPSTEAVPEAGINWIEVLHRGLRGVYFVGVFFLIIRFISQFGSIVLLAQTSKREEIQGVKVLALNKPAGPFSFFRWIFVHPGSHTNKELEEILTHERTHVNQWHSIDVIICEVINMLFWFNPFVWLLKREVRHNLEYLADNRVLESGYDSRSYQYHLLGLAHHQQGSAPLYNSFNVLHLKNRISMMNKKRSHGIGRTKYLLFLPLVLLLMIVSNIEAVARITKNVARDVASPFLQPSQTDLSETTVPVDESPAPENISPVYTVVEKMPDFPGGQSALLSYMADHIVYPKDAEEKGVEGRAIVSFVVSSNGSVRNAEIVRSIHPSLDKEAIRVVSSLPKWKPGEQGGKAVDVKYTLPINFRLKEKEEVENHIFTVVERMPEFPGGQTELLRHISRNIKYPVIAQENNIQGRVVVSMVVNADGQVVDAEVVRGIDPSLDKEALRVISTLPKWRAGEQRGKKVRVKYTIPVQFRLQ